MVQPKAFGRILLRSHSTTTPCEVADNSSSSDPELILPLPLLLAVEVYGRCLLLSGSNDTTGLAVAGDRSGSAMTLQE